LLNLFVFVNRDSAPPACSDDSEEVEPF